MPAQSPMTSKGEGWVAKVFNAHSRLGLSSTAQDEDQMLALCFPPHTERKAKTIYSFLATKARTNGGYLTLIFIALEGAFRGSLQLSEAEQFISVGQRLCFHSHQTGPCWKAALCKRKRKTDGTCKLAVICGFMSLLEADEFKT